jgi:hypothetical protein
VARGQVSVDREQERRAERQVERRAVPAVVAVKAQVDVDSADRHSP